jgi:non-homologous end joining protein Ku
MAVADLRALADSMICTAHQQDLLLRSAMRRIAELEVQHALVDARKAAAALRPRQFKLWAVLRWILGRHDR